MRNLKTCGAVAFALSSLYASAWAGGVPGQPATVLGEVNVSAGRLMGDADSASIGTVYAEQFENRPLSRPGELLEVVPGLIVTQHSGEGKANQYFLRGFNLDHGTDFATFVDGMPINMPTHAHGQGYTDINFLVPELVESVEYRKGPYYAQYGDFSTAGAAELRLKDRFEDKLVQVTAGAYGYARGVAAGSYKLYGGDLLYGVEGAHYDGAYVKNDNFNRGNLVLRYTHATAGGSWHLTAMGYTTKFDSTDQIPQRAVQMGLIDRLGCFDGGCDDGGKTHRYSLSGGFDQALGPGRLTGSAYALRYKLDLYSDFTYFLDDPVRGDQFEQFDARNVYGGRIAYSLPSTLFGLPMTSELGVSTRYDDIGTVGLYATEGRERFGTFSQDSVREWGTGVYAQTSVKFTPWLRVVPGLRFDNYSYDIASNDAANTGTASANIVQPKLSLVAGPFAKTEAFLNLGKGFHSNDARGTTATQSFDPRTGTATAIEKVTPLVATRGADLGLRTAIVPHVLATASVFLLHIDSELTFSGDAGDTEPNRPSERYGTELSLLWQPVKGLLLDADYAYTHARFRDEAPEGQHIPEATTSVAAIGATYQHPLGWFAAARFRYFGPRPLIEDGSVTSKATKIVNVDAGYRFNRRLKVALQVLNLFDSHDDDIAYYFPSRITGPNAANQEPDEGVNDIHSHPIEPINLRAIVSYNY